MGRAHHEPKLMVLTLLWNMSSCAILGCMNDNQLAETDALPNVGCCTHWAGRHDPDDGSCDHCPCVNPALVERDETDIKETTVNERTRYTATYLYPGSFFPEETSRTIPEATFEAAVVAGPDEDGYFRKDGWYAVRITAIREKRFQADDGEEAWVKQGSERVGSWIVGERVHYEDGRLAGDQFDILRSNIRSNSDDGYGVLTRCGNWQIGSDYTEVVSPPGGES